MSTGYRNAPASLDGRAWERICPLVPCKWQAMVPCNGKRYK